MQGNEWNLLVVLGPTAGGKTRLGVTLARALNGEIISADSRQVYRELNIGAGKDLEEYGSGAQAVPHHLIDAASLDEEFSVFDFQHQFYTAVEEVRGRGRLPLLVGGTGMYIDAVVRGYRLVKAPRNEALRAELAPMSLEALRERLLRIKPRLHNVTDLEDRERIVRAIEIAVHEPNHEAPPAPDVRPFLLGVQWPRHELRKRIGVRLRERMNAGLVEEVEELLASGVDAQRLYALGLEYRYVVDYLEGRVRNRNDLIQKLHSAINQFARKQEAWFRRMERQGNKIHWIDRGDVQEAMRMIPQGLGGRNTASETT
jgi:tRNA dimethylallyltransferase